MEVKQKIVIELSEFALFHVKEPFTAETFKRVAKSGLLSGPMIICRLPGQNRVLVVVVVEVVVDEVVIDEVVRVKVEVNGKQLLVEVAPKT